MRQRRIAAASLVSALGMLVCTGHLSAQNRIGFKGGVTLASADVEDLDGTFDSGNRTGWLVGGFLTLGSGLFVLQPELNLVELGFEATGLPDGPEVKLRYLQPAVLLKLGLPVVVVRPNPLGGATGDERAQGEHGQRQ